MLIIKFIPTFSDSSILFSPEDVAWQFRGRVDEEGYVYILMENLMVETSEPIWNSDIITTLVSQLHLFGIGIQGGPPIVAGMYYYKEFPDIFDQLQSYGPSMSWKWSKKGLVKLTWEELKEK